MDGETPGQAFSVAVQTADFDIAAEMQRLTAANTGIGAVVSFTGLVRGSADSVRSMELEHYPGMTEKALEKILADARARWPLDGARIIHRVGPLAPGAQIVLVLTASRHRQAAFEAAEFIMDFLKTRAPFWKREHGPDGASWVDARDSDEDATSRWDR
ncbi:molybdopterin synthase catalytic subunit MoaE [Rhodobacteraceae bacterium NNCM2]|nr:molybdopterin synthase catalytic subunit MoaE [Coraliihabitans acroporae]